MSIEFTGTDIMHIYFAFKREIEELEKAKALPKSNRVISTGDLNKEIKLYKSVTDKIEKAYPQLVKLNR